MFNVGNWILWCCLVYIIIRGANTDCSEGETSYTEKISEQKWVERQTKTVTSTYRKPKCDGIGGWFKRLFSSSCKPREVTEYKLVTRLVLETNTTFRNSCCPGFVDSGEGSCIAGCPRGSYGENCTLNCTCPDNAFDSCEKETGNCTCKSGWTGTSCNDTCELGFYGQNCKEKCTCENNSTCDIFTGDCNCTSPGWRGESCENGCSNGTYGLDCLGECACNENQSCDSVTGNCSCKPGRMGIDCQDVCPDWLFGTDCLESCKCSKGNTVMCNKTNGYCMCEAGYDGQECDLVCPFGSYGTGCQQQCKDNCNHTNYCDPFTGGCMCFGSKGDNCSEECTNGTFGVNCMETCNCPKPLSCDPVSGSCSCPTGSSCSPISTLNGVDENITAFYRPSVGDVVLPVIIAISAAVVVVLVGAVLAIALKRRRRRYLTKKEQADKEKEPTNDSDTEVLENASYIPLEMVENRGSGQNMQQRKERNEAIDQIKDSNSNGPKKKDKTYRPVVLHEVSDSGSTNDHEIGVDYTVDDVYDRTNVKFEAIAGNNYNTFEDVKRNANVGAVDEEYNVLREVKNPAKPKQENYDTFASIKSSHKTSECAQEETYNTFTENQTRQTDITEIYASAQTKEKVCGQEKDQNSLKEVYEKQSDMHNELERAFDVELENFDGEKDVYENSNSDVKLGERFGPYENTAFHQNHNEFEDDDNVYDC